ncbi:MAG: alpha/beta hydrolase [Gaiellaceae bacterium]
MWRIAILAVGAALAAGGCGSNSSSTSSTDTTDAAPPSLNTHGARVVHYTLDGRDQIAVVPKRRGNQLVVLLHGRGAGPQQFISNALFAGLAPAGSPVVVMLNGGDHSYWHDRANGKWASMVLNRAIPDAQRRFHTKGKVAIGGISMGGYGALHIASLRPRAFCAVGGHSAALWRNFKATAPGAFDNGEDYTANSVFRAISKLKKTNVWLDVGNDDPFKGADAALARKLSVVLHVFPGGHDRAYWNSHMRLYLGFYERACA